MQKRLKNIAKIQSETRGPVSHSDSYYIGVFMALGCSLSGALKSIIIKYVSKDFDTVALMFYMGFGGVFTIFAIASVDMGVNHLVEQLQMADAERWVIELRHHKSFATIKFRRIATRLSVMQASKQQNWKWPL